MRGIAISICPRPRPHHHQFIFVQKTDMAREINIFTTPESLEFALNRSKMNNAFTARYTCYKNVCPKSNGPINSQGHIIAQLSIFFFLEWLEGYYGIVDAYHALGNKN